MLEWIYYVRSKDLLGDYAQQEGPEDAPLTKAIRNELVKGGPVSLKMFSDDKPQCENCNVDPWDFGTLGCLLQQRIKCLLINCPWHVTVSFNPQLALCPWYHYSYHFTNKQSGAWRD